MTIVHIANSPEQVLASTLYGEVRGETPRTVEALAALILNRVATAKRNGGYWWWGSDVRSVCLKPWQFQCWNPPPECATGAMPDDAAFGLCLRVARRATRGLLVDPTHGACHYHRRSAHPPWAWAVIPSAVIGDFLFYKDVEPAACA